MIRYLKIGLCGLYNIWFYSLAAAGIIILFPLLLFFSLKESWYPIVFKLAALWSNVVLFCMGFYWKIDTIPKLDKGKNYMFISNHTSMIDILLMISIFKNHPFVFVGKKEFVKVPLFGSIYKRAAILVDRSSSKSRWDVYTQRKLQNGLSVCIYPEGGVPDPSVVLGKFKKGAFKIAIDHQISVVCVTFLDNKKRLPFAFSGGKPGILRVKYHEPKCTKGLSQSDVEPISNQFRELILQDLTI